MKKLLGKTYIMKLIWIFFIGSIVGYFVETSYYLIKHGVFLNKQGLLYGPIKPIYGFASVIITVCLCFFNNKNNLKVFIYGCFFGGAFEYICSLFLEYVMGTKMWHYKSSIFSINGRVNLLYLPFWGAIALLWVNFIIPVFNKIFDKISKRVMVILTVLISIFIIFDFTISIVAVNRMKERNKGIEATTKYQKFLDNHYSDEYILKRIPYIRIIDSK